jgi:hypothetical protein
MSNPATDRRRFCRTSCALARQFSGSDAKQYRLADIARELQAWRLCAEFALQQTLSTGTD